MKKLFLYFVSLFYVFLILFLKPFSFIYRAFLKNKIYLFIERGYDAEDNAFHMYNFFKNKGHNCKYIITRDSKDLNKIAEKDVVFFKSVKHFFYLNCAYRIISTHNLTYIPGVLKNEIKIKLLPFYGKVVFLQHGITKDLILPLHREKTNIDLFICGAKKEYDYVKTHYGYSKGQIKYTGLARFDYLYSKKTEKQSCKISKILIMPTWRSYLNPTNFPSSYFFKAWTDLLKTEDFMKTCLDFGITCSFLPHPEIKKIIDKNKEIEIPFLLNETHKTIQEIIVEYDLLITDFSSVFFDFAFMEKPVIYYHFDEVEYRNKHYSEGYFDYKKMGFGPVCVDKENVIIKLREYLNNSNNMIFNKRYKDFFVLDDNRNCERIYKEICEIGGEK